MTRTVPIRIRRSFILLAFGICIFSSLTSPAFTQPVTDPAATATAATPAEPLRTAIDRPIDIRNIRLDMRVDLPKKTVESQATLNVHSMRPIKSISLDAVGFEVKKVAVARGGEDAKTARFDHDGKKLTIQLDSPWAAGLNGTLKIDYRIHEPKDGLHFFAPGKADPEAPLMVWSQGQPVSNRYWIPCFDEPDQRQTTELVVTVPQEFEAISNGKLIDRKENPADKTVTFDWRQDKPHPSYLVTLVVGQFDIVREEWDGIPVTYYVPKGRKDDVARSFGRTREMLGYFSKTFGVHYPWDKYAQVVAYQFGGGMENTSATTMGELVLKDERSMLDNTPDWIIAHELAHQWWGDLMTCRDWAHLWLNEGFASYAEALWEEHAAGPDAYAYSMFGKADGAIADGKKRPVVDRRYSAPGTMFDGRAYPKGAWILHMLRHQLGDDAFWKSVHRYGDEHRLQSVETSDFRRTVERVTGRNLERFFYDWTERPGSPVLDVTTEYLPEQGQARVTVKQTQAGEAFEFPLSVVFHGPGDAKPTNIAVEVTKKEQSLLVPLTAAPSYVEVDPGLGVLGELKETKSHDWWKAQLAEAPGAVSRIRAARHLGDSKADGDREMLAQALANEKFWGAQVEIASALGKSGGDISRDALIKGGASPEARVRRACVENLGKFGHDDAIVASLKGILEKDEPSYAVTRAALIAYAKQGQKDAMAVISPWMSRPSYNDVYRAAALSALGETKDLSALETLIEHAQPGKPRAARQAAFGALNTLVRSTKPNEKHRQQVLKVYMAALEEDNRNARFSALSGLPALGATASAAIPTLEKIARNDPNETMRSVAMSRAAEIQGKVKQAASPSAGRNTAEVTQLRQEVERLKKEQQVLQEKLKKLEQGESRK